MIFFKKSKLKTLYYKPLQIAKRNRFILKRILVIDDVEIIRDSVRDILELNDYLVDTAQDGKIGLDLAEQNPPDLIICDVDMPIMNGYQVLDRVKEDPKLAMIPFIFLTAKTQQFEMREGMDLGADDYITKPFDHMDLLNSVEARFKKKKLIESEVNSKITELKLQLASTLPHEFKTPLNGIIGPSQLLIDGFEDFSHEEMKEFLEMINRSALRLNDLVDKFLYYNQLELKLLTEDQNQVVPEKKVTHNVSAIIENIIGDYTNSFDREKDVEIDVDDASILMGQDEFERILEEIGSNCFKFSNPNDKIKVSASIENDEYVIELYNQGIGFAPAQIKQIGAYNQFDRNVYEQQGIGLGLIISKRICQSNNAIFEIESEQEVYAKVIIKIPIQK